MKQKISLHLLARALSLLMPALLVPCDLLTRGTVGPGALCVDLWWALQVLMLYPSSHESVLPSLHFCGMSFLVAMGLKLAGAPPGASVLLGSSLVIGCAFFRCREKYSDIQPLFHVSAVWNGVEDHCGLLNKGITLWGGMLVQVLLPWEWALWGLSVMLVAWYAVQYWRIYMRSTLFLGAEKESQIRKTQRGSAYRQPIQYVDSDSRSAGLFNDVVRVMENRKPWLQDDFNIEDLARMTHTNRMYLSKSINFHSGRNFNQLVNFYRIRYAVDLMKKDPSLRMNEVSRMSGFHTVVSFNMAFKLNERMTPTEFVQSLKRLT